MIQKRVSLHEPRDHASNVEDAHHSTHSSPEISCLLSSRRPSTRQNVHLKRYLALTLLALTLVVLIAVVSPIVLPTITNVTETPSTVEETAAITKSNSSAKISVPEEEIHHLCNRGPEGPSCPCQLDDALRPEKKDHKRWWREAFEINLELVNKTSNIEHEGDLDVVLLGDSITEHWNGRQMGVSKPATLPTKDVFEALFQKKNGAKVNGIALGIAGDTNSNLLWRIQNGEAPGSLNPKVFWLLIGTNDLATPKCSAEIVLMGIIKCAQELMIQKPNSIIVVNGILPRAKNREGLLLHPHPHQNHTDGSNPEDSNEFDYWPVIETVNQGLKEFATKYDNVKFCNTTDIFLERKNGSIFIPTALMRDSLHPTAAGHKLWGNKIVNYLVEEIGV